ncbi:uncharacterized protein LOC124436115 [Xenia sp. Carnegie-2017]|uniref:uncharacterized protein LOC124436115 n=1 Tax=Xenia sp. Carnegie-2017 TaxID=2897299 RepID=UPI001F03E77B|nr:uncharacterized protein LOC124436115 [Xenia sp. Carnegie-2017]
MGAIPKGTKYIKTIPFFLKIAEFGVLLIAMSTLGAFLHNVGSVINPWGGKGSLYFGMFAIVVSWIVVMVMVVVFVTGLHEKVTVINWPLTVFINMVLWGVMLLIACGVMSNTLRKYYSKKTSYTLCNFLDTDKVGVTCFHLISATVCCFIATIILAVDANLNYHLFKSRTCTTTPVTLII